jgi:sulfur carrier protein
LPATRAVRWPIRPEPPVHIILNGEPYEVDQPLSVAELLEKLEIDERRVAIEYNFSILKRYAFPQTMVCEGDRLEIVNFVGGG